VALAIQQRSLFSDRTLFQQEKRGVYSPFGSDSLIHGA